MEAGKLPYPNQRSLNGIPFRCKYQYDIAKLDIVSITPIKPYDCSINCQSTKRSVLGLRGLRRRTSASGVSYARTVAAAQSVKQLRDVSAALHGRFQDLPDDYHEETG